MKKLSQIKQQILNLLYKEGDVDVPNEISNIMDDVELRGRMLLIYGLVLGWATAMIGVCIYSIINHG